MRITFCCGNLAAGQRVYGVTGCDTVATYQGIGKGMALRVLMSGKHSLSNVGDVNSSLDDVLKQATPFISFFTSCAELLEDQLQTAHLVSFTWASHIAASVLT